MVVVKGPADADGGTDAAADDMALKEDDDATCNRDTADDVALGDADADGITTDLMVVLVEWCRFRCIFNVEFWAVAYSQ